jgi:glycine oxidase
VNVIVIGGGAIGLSIAWRAAGAGLSVTVVDPEPGSGATFASAGMLAPVTEAHYGEEGLLQLALASAARWPSFASSLEEAAGRSIGYSPTGTLVAAYDADDHAQLEDLYQYQVSLGLDARRLRRAEARDLEPMLSPSIRSGMLAGDHRVDPRALVAALLVAAESAGVVLRREAVASVIVEGSAVVGVESAGGSRMESDWVVMAAGCWSASVGGLPDHARPPVRPVKGQILTLRGPALLSRAVRGLVKGSSVYLVPREDGRVVVGATVEERGWDTTVTAGGVYELLREATLLVPGVSELELLDVRAGLRPGSPDNAPLIGAGALAGLAIATGHFRNGILLTPVTAEAVVELLVEGAVPDVALPFAPDRFTSSVVRS